jgi:putative FmdB family regulatory protein
VPLYDYDCASCGHRFEVMHGVHADAPSACPNCGSAQLRKAFAAPAIHFKGSGWAKKERRATSSPGSSKAGSPDGQGSTDGKGDGPDKGGDGATGDSATGDSGAGGSSSGPDGTSNGGSKVAASTKTSSSTATSAATSGSSD